MIKWDGGERPCGWEDTVEVQFRNGEKETCAAGDFSPLVGPSTPINDNWMHSGNRYDIVAYRIVKRL